jgi:Phospholipase_D-nuclease N-terminal
MCFAALLQQGGGGWVAGFFGVWLVLFILAILASIFWLWMLITALVNEPTPNDKILWFLVIFFLHFIGALIYFFVRYRAAPRTPSPF